MKILVTGGSGLIGRHLIERLAPRHEVVSVGRTPPPDDRVEHVQQDLTMPLKGLPEELDAVVHLAQSERYREFPEGARDVFGVNVQSAFELLEHARRSGARSFVLASTGGLYRPSHEPIGEDAPVAAESPYLRSKLIAELLAASYEELFSCVVIRPFFVYGPGPSRLLISRLAGQILSGDEILVDGLPGMRINPIHARDAAGMIEATLGLEEGVVLNIAGDEVVTVAELATRLAAALGREAILRPSGADSAGDLIGDATRAKHLLGTRPEIGLDEGLATL